MLQLLLLVQNGVGVIFEYLRKHSKVLIVKRLLEILELFGELILSFALIGEDFGVLTLLLLEIQEQLLVILECHIKALFGIVAKLFNKL